MAKTAHWYIQFISRTGIKRRAYIYDDYTGSVPASWPIRLDCEGDEPFQTNGSNDGDIFEPIRTSSGMVKICTAIPGGGMLSAEDLIPNDNISRYIKLVDVSIVNQTEVESVVWSGFLSCESLDQDFIGIPSYIEFNIISSLQAADSVELDQDDRYAFATILTHIAYAIRSLEQKSGIQLFDNIYISSRFYNAIKDKCIFSNSYLKIEENTIGDNTYEEVNSLSVNEILSQITTFFGLCVCENGKDIFFTDEKTTSYKRIVVSNLYESLLDNTGTLQSEDVQCSTISLNDLDWTGSEHKKSVYTGKKRAIVSASLKDFSLKMSLVEPSGDSLVQNPTSRQTPTQTTIYANTNRQYYSHITHKHHSLKAIFPTDLSTPSLSYIRENPNSVYQSTYFWAANQIRDYYKELIVDRSHGHDSGIYYYVTSYMGLWLDTNSTLQSGLMVSGFPWHLYASFAPVYWLDITQFTLTENMYLFKNITPLTFAAKNGFINLNSNVLAWFNVLGRKSNPCYNEGMVSAINMALKFGNKWATYDMSTGTTGWTDNFNTFFVKYDNEGKIIGNWWDGIGIEQTDGLLFQINSAMTGYVSLYIFPYIDALNAVSAPYSECSSFFDVFISKLDVKYISIPDNTKNSRSENRYVKDIKNGYQEEKEINTNIASFANNSKLANVLHTDINTPCTLLSLDGVDIRPEVDLLNRMANYYKKVRTKIDVDGLKQSNQILPITKVTGIADGKIYIPIAESKNWKLDTSTITFIESNDSSQNNSPSREQLVDVLDDSENIQLTPTP